MSTESSLWYRVGYALEQARQLPSRAPDRLSGLKERVASATGSRHNGAARGKKKAAGRDHGAIPVEELVTTAALALAAKAVEKVRPDGPSGIGPILRAGAAGAAAAFLVELARPLLHHEDDPPRLDDGTPEHLLSGAAQGLVYGAVLEPLLPGPSLLKGSLFGSAEYALEASGGSTRLLLRRTPLGRVPMMLTLLDGLESRERGFLEHVTFGVALAALYGSSRSRSGTRDEA